MSTAGRLALWPAALLRVTEESEALAPTPAPARPDRASTAGAGHGEIALALYSDLDAAAEVWCDFEQKADLTPFQTFGWLAAWQRHIGAPRGVRPAIVVGRGPDGTPSFILPLAVERSKGMRRLTFLGSDLADYNAPLLAKEFTTAVEPGRFAGLWQAVIDLINADRSLSFDLVELAKMPERVGTQANPMLELPVSLNPSGAHRTALGESWEAYYGKRSSATRRRDRTKFSRLAAYGEIAFIEPERAADIEVTLHCLFEQKAGSFARMGVRDPFAEAGYRDFYLDLALDPDLGDLVQVARLDVGEETAAATFCLRWKGACYYLLASYQAGELARFGPGAQHLRHLMQLAIERGFSHFDFTIGDEAYKRDWCEEELKLYDHCAARRWRALPVLIAARAFRRTKRFVKQTPALWRLYARTRAVLARFKFTGER